MIKRTLKWLGFGLLGLLVVAVAYRTLTVDATNERVAEEIRNNPTGERAARAMLIWLEDGTMYPVNYLHEGDQVFMGIDGRWWRAFRGEGAPVRMLIKGEHYQGHARVVLDDPDYTEAVFARLRPTVPEWLPDWLNGKLVVITLQ